MPVQIPAYGGRPGAGGQARPVGVPVEPAPAARRRGRAMQRRGRARQRLDRARQVASSILLASVITLILVGVAGMVLGLWRFTVIDTGSMRPTLDPGDVAILGSEPLAALRKGQIVAFHPPGDPRLTVMHRVFSIHHARDGVTIRTKGDANNALDPWHARIVGNTVWHERLKVPKMGYLAAWSQQRPVRLGVLIVTVLVIVSMGMGSIWAPRS